MENPVPSQPATPIIPVQEQNLATQSPKKSFPFKIIVLVFILVILVIGSASAAYLRIKSTSPKPVQPSKPTPIDETANWKTYKNTKYDIELQYPKDLLIERGVACPKEYLNPDVIVSLFLKNIKECTPDMPSPLVIYQTKNFNYPTSDDKCYLVQKTTMVINKIETQKYTTIFDFKNRTCVERGLGPSFLKQTDIFLIKNGKNFVITYGSPDNMPGVKDIPEKILTQIVSTIKFTDLQESKTVVENFYQWYLPCVENFFITAGTTKEGSKSSPGETCSIIGRKDVTDKLIKDVSFASAIGHDPILCAQNTPNTNKLDLTEGYKTADSAIIYVKMDFAGNNKPFTVNLISSHGQWKMNEISCTNLP